MRSKIYAENGYTLTYEGTQFTDQGIVYPKEKAAHLIENSGEVPEKTFQFCRDFSNLGALLMRYHFGQGQRSATMSQMARSDYEKYAIDLIAEGRDQNNLFAPGEHASLAMEQTMHLQALFSYPLGEAKILNRLTQALREKNQGSSGEQGYFGTLHIGVWQPAISLPNQLTKNNFSYIACPEGITSEEYEHIAHDLQNNRFSLIQGETKLLVSGYELDLLPFSKITANPQNQEGMTFQKNGLLITKKGSLEQAAPMGWIIHTKQQKIVAQNDAEDLLRLIRLGEGKFHQLSKEQQQILTAGRLGERDGEVRFTQNRQLNAMLALFSILEKDFGFDPTPLMNNNLKLIAKNSQKTIETTDVVDDILTGYLQSEMIQHLVVTKPSSQRVPLSENFNLSFANIKNNTKSLAHAFKIKDGEGTSILSVDSETPFYSDPQLQDIGVHGELLMPSLTDSRHSSALLATAILVAEQMILEQLLNSIIQENKNELHESTLKSILTFCLGEQSDVAFAHLCQLAKNCPAPDGQALLGLQYEHCAELIAALRGYIGTDQLIILSERLGTETHSSPEQVLAGFSPHVREHMLQKLGNLHLICDELQKNEAISAEKVGSKGAIVGTSLLLNKLAPDLAQQLHLEQMQSARHQDDVVSKPRSTKELISCPYLNAQTRSYNAPQGPDFFQQKRSDIAHQILNNPAHSSSQSSWPSFFAKSGAMLLGMGAMVATAYTLSQK